MAVGGMARSERTPMNRPESRSPTRAPPSPMEPQGPEVRSRVRAFPPPSWSAAAAYPAPVISGAVIRVFGKDSLTLRSHPGRHVMVGIRAARGKSHGRPCSTVRKPVKDWSTKGQRGRELAREPVAVAATSSGRRSVGMAALRGRIRPGFGRGARWGVSPPGRSHSGPAAGGVCPPTRSPSPKPPETARATVIASRRRSDAGRVSLRCLDCFVAVLLAMTRRRGMIASSPPRAIALVSPR
jgi:hypothetical protein